VTKRLVSTLIVGCALLTVPPAASPALAQAAVKIGLIAPTKSLVGTQLIQGAQVAVDMVNAAGGILGGRKIQLVEYDTAFQPNEGVAAAQRLINQDGVKVIAGEISSTVALAVLQVARASGSLFVAAVPKHPDVTKSGYDRVFRLNSTTAMDAEFNDVLKNEIKPQKVAVIAENSDFGRLTIDNMKALFGSQVVLAETYEMNQSDFSTLVTKTKASGADLICIAGSNMEQYGSILRMQQELKVPGRRCLMPGILNSKGVEVAGAGAEGALSADIYVPSMPGDLNRTFVEAFQARFRHAPEKIEVLGFESIWLVAQAMTKAATADDAGKISDVLRANTWTTPRGDVKFDAGGQASSGSLVRLVVKDGVIVPERR
jgi:branched-chain amino acid transport system substrate-binding protein